jgi:hypothetical protein
MPKLQESTGSGQKQAKVLPDEYHYGFNMN